MLPDQHHSHGEVHATKKVIWMLLVGCAAVAIFYPLVFQYEKDAALHAQSNTSSAQTGANQSFSSLQAQEPASIVGTQLSANAPQSSVMSPPQNKIETQQPPEPVRQSLSSLESLSDDFQTTSSMSSKVLLSDSEFSQGDEPQKHPEKRFIKMDPSGKQLSDDADNWACVYDSKTQLLWESSIGISHNLRYRWSESSAKDESPEHCPYFAGNMEDKIENCTTSLRVGVANSTQLCGSSSWQLPSISEFETIIVPDKYNPSINTPYFPYTQSDYYWTREGFAYSEFNAWAVNFSIGKVNDVNKAEFIFVRLVSNTTTNNEF